MNQADVSKLISKLKFKIEHRHRNLKNVHGPEGRLLKLRKTVTALIKHERIELNHYRADESRGYAERLISEAIRHGDCHQPTMEMADYWLLEKQLVHKLFKVLAPRYKDYNISFTRMMNAPTYPNDDPRYRRTVLELRGNIYPSLAPETRNNRNLIHNLLLDEARKEYRAQKYAEIAANIALGSQETSNSEVTANIALGSQETSNSEVTTNIALGSQDTSNSESTDISTK